VLPVADLRPATAEAQRQCRELNDNRGDGAILYAPS
jgi:hypothetical protein